MKTNSALQVLYNGRLVGTLAVIANNKAALTKILTRDYLEDVNQMLGRYLL